MKNAKNIGVAGRMLMLAPLLPPHLLAGVGITGYITFATPYDGAYFAIKVAAFTAMSGVFGRCLIPFLAAVPPSVVGSAILATGVTLGSLCTVVAIAPSEQFLTWGSFVGAGSGIMMGASLAAMYKP